MVLHNFLMKPLAFYIQQTESAKIFRHAFWYALTLHSIYKGLLFIFSKIWENISDALCHSWIGSFDLFIYPMCHHEPVPYYSFLPEMGPVSANYASRVHKHFN